MASDMQNGGTIDGPPLAVTDLGSLAYREAYTHQSEMADKVIASRDTPAPILGHIFLVEHDPVITVSARAGAGRNVLASSEQLARAGVSVEQTDRGGDVTYHGPGQLVVYPVIDLNACGLRLHEYMRLLEQVVIDVCTHFDVTAGRDPGATGVWVRRPDGTAKIAALGVRVRKWVSMHGLALNVITNLEHFDLIVPCGLVGRRVTSMEHELGPHCPALDAVKSVMASHLRRAILERARARRSRRHPPGDSPHGH